MFKPLFCLFFWSILFLMVSRSNQIEQTSNSHYLKANSSSYINKVRNYFSKFNFLNLFKSDNMSPFKTTDQLQLDQQNLIDLINKSNKFNLEHSDYLRIKKFKKLENETKKSMRTKLKTDLLSTFSKVYESKYPQFCSCPPKLQNANHNLEDFKYDKEDTDCIYLPSTAVEYYCRKGTRRKNSINKIVINKLICNLNENTNRLEWIIDIDDKLIDLDDRLVYSDELVINNKLDEFDSRSFNDEELEIRLQSTNLSEFSFQFLQCACKLIQLSQFLFSIGKKHFLFKFLCLNFSKFIQRF